MIPHTAKDPLDEMIEENLTYFRKNLVEFSGELKERLQGALEATRLHAEYDRLKRGPIHGPAPSLLRH
jgi:hypothetical protein